jgi:hypothetical protein
LQQEDYIKRQIDQLGRVLGKILADITGLSSNSNGSDGIEIADQLIKDELALNFSEMYQMPAEKVIQILRGNKKFSDENIDKVADIFFMLAEKPGRNGASIDQKQKFLGLALAFYEHLDKTSLTYSFDRHLKIMKIRSAL